MQTTNDIKNTTTWLTITLGLIGLAVTFAYFKSIVNGFVVYHTTIDIFELYGWTLLIVGGLLTIWTIIKLKSFKQYWPLMTIYLLNLFLLYYCYSIMKPMPYQIRFSLTNKTNSKLTDIKVIGIKDAKLKDLAESEKIDFIFSDYDENTDIDLVCKVNDISDTLNLAAGMTNSCGYYYDINLTTKNGHLSK